MKLRKNTLCRTHAAVKYIPLEKARVGNGRERNISFSWEGAGNRKRVTKQVFTSRRRCHPSDLKLEANPEY